MRTTQSFPPGKVPASSPSNPSAGRRPLITGAVLALMLLVGLAVVRSRWPSPPPSLGEPVAFLELTRGSVQVVPPSGGQDPSRLLALGAGEPIHAGSTIDTGAAAGDTAGRAALRLANGASLRLDHDSRVQIASGGTIELERGAVYVDSKLSSAVEVRTTFGVVRDIGTQFEVRLLDADATADSAVLRVRVREGEVVLERDGASHGASAGAQLILRGEEVSRGTSPVWGAEWAWVLEAAVAPEIDGRPLTDFLDWAVREGGWTLRYADDATAALAAETRLNGDARGLTVEEAAALVLRGSGLDFRIEEGELVVTAGEPEGR